MLLQFCSVFIVCVVMQMYRCHDTCVKVRGNRSGVGFPTLAFKQQTRFRRLTGQALFIHEIIKDAPKGLIYRELHNYTRWSLFLSETNAVFLKTDRIFFLFKLLYMCTCAHVYMYTWIHEYGCWWRPEEATRSPESGVTGACDPPHYVLRRKLGFSARTIFPAPLFAVLTLKECILTLVNT